MRGSLRIVILEGLLSRSSEGVVSRPLKYPEGQNIGIEQRCEKSQIYFTSGVVVGFPDSLSGKIESLLNDG